MRAAALLEPAGEGFEVARQRAHLLQGLLGAPAGIQHAMSDAEKVLMHIQAGAIAYEYVHRSPPYGPSGRRGRGPGTAWGRESGMRATPQGATKGSSSRCPRAGCATGS